MNPNIRPQHAHPMSAMNPQPYAQMHHAIMQQGPAQSQQPNYPNFPNYQSPAPPPRAQSVQQTPPRYPQMMPHQPPILPARMQQHRPDMMPDQNNLSSPMPLPSQDPNQQTMAWASRNYVWPCDSGFQSAQTASVISSSRFSGISNLTGLTASEAGGEYYGNFLETVSQSGPATMVYVQPQGPTPTESGAGNFDFSNVQGPPRFQQGQQAFFQQPPSQNYPNAQVISLQKLTQCLRDQEVMKIAASTVYNFAKDPEMASHMARCPELIDAVVAAMVTAAEAKDYEVTKWTTGTMYHISNLEEGDDRRVKVGLEPIYRSGAIPSLIQLLSFEFECVVSFTVTVLHNLLSHHEASKEVIRAANGVEELIKLLPRDHDKLLSIVMDCLRILCHFHLESKLKVVQSGALSRIVQSLESNYEKLLWMTSRLLLSLSSVQSIKEPIVQAGGVMALARHLAHPSHRLVRTCLNALRDLSDVCIYLDGLEGLLDSLIQNLGSSDVIVVDYCLAILGNLTCRNQKNKEYVCSKMGIESLTRTLNERWDNPSVVENTLGTLRHLIWKCGSAQTSRNKLRSLGCLPLIGRYLRLQELPLTFYEHPTVIVEALSLIGYLTMGGGASWPDFRHYDIVGSAANLVCYVVQTVLGRVAHKPPLLSGYFSVLERAFATLKGLCQDEENRHLLLMHPDIATQANELFYHPAGGGGVKQMASEFLRELHTSHNTGAERTQEDHLDEETRFAYEFGMIQQQEASFLQPTQMNVDERIWPRQNDDHSQQAPYNSVSMPSPMAWSQQELPSTGYADVFDCAVGVFNDMPTVVPPPPITQQSDNVPGPSYVSHTALEPMQNLHL